MDAVLALDGGQDESAGLCELLEIIDAWLGDSHGASDAKARLPCSVTASSPPSVRPESVVAASESITAALPFAAAPSGLTQDGNGGEAPRITAKRVPVSGSKRQRERNTAVDMLRRLKKRAEQSLLRVEVRDLEFQLAALQRSRCGELAAARARDLHLASLASSGDDTPGEDGDADKQHQSVQVNHQLRDRVAKNDALLRSIRDALHHSSTSNDKGNLLSKACARRLSTIDGGPNQCGGKAPSLEALLHVNLDYVLRKLPPLTADGLVCSSETTVDAFGSPRFEIKTATTLGCGIHAFSPLFAEQFRETSGFARMILKCLTTNENVLEDFNSREIRYRGATLLLRSSGVMYKSDNENGDIILTRSSRMTNADGAVGFHGRSWIIATRSPQSPTEMTTVRTLYELTPESISPSVVSIGGERLEKVRASLLRVLTERLRRKHAHLQHTLLVATGRDDLAAIIDV